MPQITIEALETRLVPAVTFTASFDDPTAANVEYYSGLEQNLVAAGAEWARYLDGTATIDVVFAFSDSVPRANGGSVTIVFVRNEDGVNVYQEGAASEIKTGIDPNGITPDLRITIGNSYLRNELWLDPTPFSDGDEIPGHSTDAFSVLVHELGHGLGFIGYGDSEDGSLPGNSATLYDQLVTFEDGNLYFTGPAAMGVYGGPVPLTFGNHFHLANNMPRPGSELLSDVMNGVAFQRGTRYRPSALDLAILSDNEVPLAEDPLTNHAPVVAPQTYSIVEHSSNGTLVATVVASDPDFQQELIYRIVAGNAAGIFIINSLTGSITISKGSLLDFDTQATHVLTVEVADNGNPSLATTTGITIDVTERVLPTITTSGGATTRGKSLSVVVDTAADFQAGPDFTDPVDSVLRATISSGMHSKDRLLISTSGDRNTRLTVRKLELRRGTTAIGRVSGGTGGETLAISFNSNAGLDDVQFVLRRISLQTRRKNVGTRTILFEIDLPQTDEAPFATKDVVVI